MRWVDNRQLPIESCEVELSGESWVVEACLNRFNIRDKAGNVFSIDSEDRCYVTKGPMLDIFGDVRKRVEIPDPLCQCLRDVAREVLVRHID